MAKEAKDTTVKTTKKPVVAEKTTSKKNAVVEKSTSKKTVDATPDKNAIKKHFQTPTETWWGKLIVWVIMFGMVGLIILQFILSILNGQA